MAENSRRWAEISRRYRTYIKLEKRLSANTVESYMRDLEQFAHFVLRMWDVPPRKVESQMIERYMAWLYDRGCEKSSQARALSGLKSFFNYLLLTDAIESSPLEFIEMPKFSRRLPDVLSTAEIDRAVYDYTTSHGAIPAPLNYEGFPKSVCTSVNDVVCHGIPSEREILRDGDIVNVDVSTILDGYYSDASRMFLIGNVSPERRRLVEVTRECLRIGMEAARPFGFVGDIGHAIQRHAEKNGYSVVRELCGHGVGLAFHEEPDIEHFGRRGTGMVLVPGMVFTIEPMINMGSRSIFIDEADGWTVLTDDGLPSAQWEHTFVMTESGPEILTY